MPRKKIFIQTEPFHIATTDSRGVQVIKVLSNGNSMTEFNTAQALQGFRQKKDSPELLEIRKELALSLLN